MIVTKKSQELKNSQSVFFPEVVATVLSKAGWPIFLNIAPKKADAQYGKTTGSHSLFPWVCPEKVRDKEATTGWEK